MKETVCGCFFLNTVYMYILHISVVYQNFACVPLDDNDVAVLKINKTRGNASEIDIGYVFFDIIATLMTASLFCPWHAACMHAAVNAYELTPQCNSVSPVTLHEQCHGHQSRMNAKCGTGISCRCVYRRFWLQAIDRKTALASPVITDFPRTYCVAVCALDRGIKNFVIKSRWVLRRQTNITKTMHISAGEMYSSLCIEWTGDHFGLG